MILDLGSLNFLAVILGAVVYFVIGAVWFSPMLFAKPWMAAIGWDESRPRPEMSPVTYAGPAIFYLVSAIATGLLAKATGTDTLTEGIILGLVVGVGYALVVTATDALFDPNKPKPWNWFAISGSYHVLSLVIVGAIFGLLH